MHWILALLLALLCASAAARDTLALGDYRLQQEPGDYALFLDATARADIEALLPTSADADWSDWEKSQGRLPVLLKGITASDATALQARAVNGFLSPLYRLERDQDAPLPWFGAASPAARRGAPVYLSPQIIVSCDQLPKNLPRSAGAMPPPAGGGWPTKGKSSLPRSARELPLLKNTYVLESNARTIDQFAADLAHIAAQPGVRWAQPNFIRLLETRGLPNDPLLADQWHLINDGRDGGIVGADLNVADAWETTIGTGQIISIIDNGSLHSHPDLMPNFRAGYDPVMDIEGDEAGDPDGDRFHGTATAGLAAARGNNGEGVVGVAHGAEFVAVSLLKYRVVTDVHIALAFLWSVEQGAGVISNSYGPRDGFWEVFEITPLLAETFAYVRDDARDGRGSVIVFAAGNGDEPLAFDALSANPWAIAIGASTRRDVRAPYSDYGPPLAVLAPSSDIPLDAPEITTTSTGDEPYTNLFGLTSAAAPQAAGVAALVRSVAPNLAAEDVTAILQQSAREIAIQDAAYDRNGGSWAYGKGRIDATRAINLAMNADQQTTPTAPLAPRVKQRGQRYFLEFSAPGVNGEPALRYDIRATTGTLTEENWDDALGFAHPPLPRRPGVIERIAFQPPFGEETLIAVRAYSYVGTPGPISTAARVPAFREVPPLLLSSYDFETDHPGVQLADGWARVPGIGRDASYGITDSPGGNYPEETVRRVILPTIETTGLFGLQIVFDERFFLEVGTGAATGFPYDVGRVEVSLNGGTNWQPTLSISNGEQNEWRTNTVDFSYFDGADTITPRFRMTSDIAVQMDGWYIDNVEFYAWRDLDSVGLDTKDALLGHPSPATRDRNSDRVFDAADLLQ